MKALLSLAMTVTFATCVCAEDSKKANEINGIDFKGNIDHAVIKVQAGKLWVVKVLGTPSRMSVSGRTYNPKWQGNESEPFTKFEGNFKPFNDGTVKLQVKRGRSTVQITELPTAANAWTLTVKIADAPNGDGDYYINLSW